MKRGNFLFGLTFCLLLAGCSHEDSSASHSGGTWRDRLPAPVIDSAKYTGEGGANRDTIEVAGAFFTTQPPSAKSDVVTSSDLRNWTPAKKITQPSDGKTIAAQVADPAGTEHVWVRVFGMNGHYTEPFMIQKFATGR